MNKHAALQIIKRKLLYTWLPVAVLVLVTVLTVK